MTMLIPRRKLQLKWSFVVWNKQILLLILHTTAKY
jgi:hypothetical protein